MIKCNIFKEGDYILVYQLCGFSTCKVERVVENKKKICIQVFDTQTHLSALYDYIWDKDMLYKTFAYTENAFISSYGNGTINTVILNMKGIHTIFDILEEFSAVYYKLWSKRYMLHTNRLYLFDKLEDLYKLNELVFGERYMKPKNFTIRCDYTSSNYITKKLNCTLYHSFKQYPIYFGWLGKCKEFMYTTRKDLPIFDLNTFKACVKIREGRKKRLESLFHTKHLTMFRG